jgi:hypothetical protein
MKLLQAPNPIAFVFVRGNCNNFKKIPPNPKEDPFKDQRGVV